MRLDLQMMLDTTDDHIPPLPSYTLSPLPPISPIVSDQLFALLIPIVAYWVVSLGFHILDVYDLGSKYRLHTPAEVLKRNHVTRGEVLRDVLLQQLIQTVFGLAIGMLDPVETIGRELYDLARLARLIRRATGYVPAILAVGGVDTAKLSSKIAGPYPTMAGVLLGGRYPHLTQEISNIAGKTVLVPGFAPWELLAARLMYWLLIPAIQFGTAMFIVDTWQYFWHRAMHMNKWLYTNLHSRHHRLYVPYAFGALYNHPGEGFLLDTLGAGIAYLVTRMTTRQGMWFFTFSTVKTIDDHCGYAFPWDPLQYLTSNNAAYHDVHHQSWGIKTNFSQPFSTFWDRLLGTAWSGGDVSARYERARQAAQKKVDEGDAAAVSAQKTMVNTPRIDLQRAVEQAAASQQQVLQDKVSGGPQVIEQERLEEMEARLRPRKRSIRKTSRFDSRSEGLRGLTGRVSNAVPSYCPNLHPS